MISAAEGNTTSHQAPDRDCRPGRRRPPSGPMPESGARTPNPRKLSAASRMMAPADGQGRVHDDRAESVGQDVAEDDPPVASPRRSRRLDELLLPKRQELSPDDAGQAFPTGEAEQQRQRDKASSAPEERPEELRGHDGHGEQRQAEDEVGEPHERLVDPAPVVPGHGPHDWCRYTATSRPGEAGHRPGWCARRRPPGTRRRAPGRRCRTGSRSGEPAGSSASGRCRPRTAPDGILQPGMASAKTTSTDHDQSITTDASIARR